MNIENRSNIRSIIIDRPVNKIWEFAAKEIEKNVVPQIKPEYGSDFALQLGLLSREKVTPFLFSNHRSFADGLAFMVVAKHISFILNYYQSEKQFPGFKLIVAGSLVSGDQRADLGIGFRHMQPLLNQHNTDPIPYIREDDLKKYGMDPKKNLPNLLRVARSIRAGFGIGGFPQGTMREGRRRFRLIGPANKKSAFTAMDFGGLFEMAKNEGRTSVIIPMRIEKSENLYSPDSKFFTPQGLLATFGKIDAGKVMQVYVGKPTIWKGPNNTELIREEVESQVQRLK